MRMTLGMLIIALAAIACPVNGASKIAVQVTNPGFENLMSGVDVPGWGWHSSSTASFQLSADNPHSGKRCLIFKSESDTAPNKYGRLYQSIPVMPSVKYELSIWVQGKDIADGMHVADWKSYRLDIPAGTYRWQKLSTVITTREGQSVLDIGINIVNKCSALAIDDIMLRPVGAAIKGNGISGVVQIPETVAGDGKQAGLRVLVDSKLREAATLSIAVTAGSISLLEKTTPINPGINQIDYEWNTGDTSEGELKCSVRILDHKQRVLASAVSRVEKQSRRTILEALERVEERLREFDSLAAKCRDKNINLDYQMVARTMLEQFIPLTRQDVEDGEEKRAAYAVRDFNRALDESLAQMRSYLKNPSSAPVTRRYQTGKVGIKGTSFIGSRKDSNGTSSTGPVFFCGYGHFNQVVEDMPRWPGYGVNIIQSAEFGPSAVFQSEETVYLGAVEKLQRTLDAAAEHNVRVDFLISPHWFPEWAIKKWPHLSKGGGGFIGFCVDCPEAKDLIEKYLRLVIPMVKDKPALHSICLTNEPMFDKGAGCDETKRMWIDYLTRTHGDVDRLNNCYGTKHASISDVPIPENTSYADPQFYDWCTFNQQRFAGWHKWMADIIHEMAPQVPVHAKVMWVPIAMRESATWGLDPELFAELSDINGNDCVIFPGSPDHAWSISWIDQNMLYDLQRSLARQPIFNSENHLHPYGEIEYVGPEHYRTVLWQGAVHGQGATTLWIWQRILSAKVKSEEENYVYGHVMDRPGCAQALGTTNLDLNRYAEEVTALQNVEAPVALVYSMSSYVKQADYLPTLRRVYTALNFCGVKVDFITEKQLAAGMGRKYKLIVLAGATHLTNDALDKLIILPASTRIVLVGDGANLDPYNQPHAPELVAGLRNKSTCLDAFASPELVLWPKFRAELEEMKVLPEISVVDAKTGKPVWGIEWLTTSLQGKTYVNMVNLTTRPVNVEVRSTGIPQKVRSLLSPGIAKEIRRLDPAAPVLGIIESGR
ncbi:MAG: beta-galactosidase [Armatimonadota bacterium]